MLDPDDSRLVQTHPLLQVCLDLTASLPAEDRYRRIATAVREVIPAQVVVISRVHSVGAEPNAEPVLEPVVAQGLVQDAMEWVQLRASAHRRVLQELHPVRLRASPQTAASASEVGVDVARALAPTEVSRSQAPLATEPATEAFLGVALRVESEVVGTLAMTSAVPGAFNHVPDHTVVAFAALTAAALRTASLLDTLELERELLRDHVALEALVLDISTRFIDVPVEHIGSAIYNALRRIGEFAGADRCYVLELDSLAAAAVPAYGRAGLEAFSISGCETGLRAGCTSRREGNFRGRQESAPEAADWRTLHEWCAPGIAAHGAGAETVAGPLRKAGQDWLRQQIAARHTVWVPDVAELPQSAAARAWGQLQGCRSLLVLPLDLGAQSLGAVAFDTVTAPRPWDEHTVMLLRTVGNIVGSALERQRHAEVQRRSRSDLERKVDARTAELRVKQGQLVQAEKMAALGELVAGIAHEVNTPLGAIHSNNQTLRRTLRRLREHYDSGTTGGPTIERLFDMGERLCRVSEDAIARITRIVGGTRNFARLDQGRVERVDLRECMDSTLALVQHKLRGRVQVECTYARDMPRVECYPSQINQVFMNLLVNAAQAIRGTGGLKVSGNLRGDCVEFSIEDNGVGMTPEHVRRMFEPGFTTKGVGVGTGLGLAIVRRIIDGHGGDIAVESRPQEGTRVTVTLPIKHSGACPGPRARAECER